MSKHFCDDQIDRLRDILRIYRKETFPNIYSLLLTLAVCPISSVSVERFFSTVNKGMIPTRKSMTVERLNNLCVLSVELEHDLILRYSWKKSINLVKSEYRKLLKSRAINLICICIYTARFFKLLVVGFFDGWIGPKWKSKWGKLMLQTCYTFQYFTKIYNIDFDFLILKNPLY